MRSFPDQFVWGTATASYQIEGGWRSGGRGLSIWDDFARRPGRVSQAQNGDVACDHYNRFREDVDLMKAMGVSAYRFSIAWPRIIPDGRGEVNEAGVRFYHDLIDCLRDRGIEPWVTLYHWDLPLALERSEGGWLNPDIADTFATYAGVCFERFGDRVKRWITLNEPWCCAKLGYGEGVMAPGRRSDSEPYLVGHNLLRAHAKAVDLYRRRFQDRQKGEIGITNNCDWREPFADTASDQAAAQRSLESFLGWFADPIYFGDYPESMRASLGERLPVFSDSDRALVCGSSDFFGLNHYTTALVAAGTRENEPDQNPQGNGGIDQDCGARFRADPSWEQTDMDWSIVPWGCRKLLEWITERYGRPPIYITENGCAVPGEDQREAALNDDLRVDYLRGYLVECHRALEAGVDLRGYFCWTLMDNFEWAHGYGKRFGLHFVDFDTLERVPKKSAHWYGQLVRTGTIPDLTPQP